MVAVWEPSTRWQNKQQHYSKIRIRLRSIMLRSLIIVRPIQRNFKDQWLISSFGLFRQRLL